MSINDKNDHAFSATNDQSGNSSELQMPLLQLVTENILNNAEEGIFFLNKFLELNRYYSKSIERILGITNLEEKNFIDILENRIPSQIIENTKEFLKLMFQDDLDEEVIKELNPLIETEFFYEDEWGIWTTSKYLSFNFRRVKKSDSIKFLLTTVQDVSEKVFLNQKLKMTEDRTQKQMEWLVNILHVEPEMLKEFFVGVEHELIRIEEVLKNSKDSKNHRELIEIIYRSLFIIKGNASLLDLRFFTEKTNQFIEKILSLKNHDDLSGADFVPIVVSLGDMRDTLVEVRTIFKRISHFHIHFRIKRNYECELLVNSLKSLIKNLSKQLDKEVDFDYKDFDVLAIPYNYRQMVKDILFLLLRNTILYGIEEIALRKSINKNPHAMIKISSFVDNGFLGLKLKHDGRIDRIERMIHKMISKKNNDKVLESSFEGVQVTQLLCTPDIEFSKDNEALENYSMDMELLKRKLKEKGGRLKITFTSEDHCEFTILLPLSRIKSVTSSNSQND